MKRFFWMFFLMSLFLTGASYAEEPAAAPEAAPAAPAEPAPSAESLNAEPLSVEAPAALPQEALLVDNLEFISGEISELDETAKTVSVRLYGENENTTSEKVLKVGVDENTDITDGEQDRDLKSLAVGTEVDVEYDPATNKATYIFVY